jgi:FKBP-type peptidyl-prolyl cis-trans isomerase
MKKYSRIFVLCFLSLSLILLASCDPSKKWQKEERSQINNYLNSQGDTVVLLKPSGLYYIEVQAGTGRMPIAKDTVSMRFEGTFLDGTVFGSNLQDSVDYSFIVGTNTVIPGIDEGVTYMKEGGISRLLIPSNLAYGPTGYLSIPGYTPILFEINLVKVRPASKK